MIANNYMDITFPAWFFAENGVRNEGIRLDTIIEELVGEDQSDPLDFGTGIAVFPDYRDPEHPNYKGYNWDNFNRIVDALGELLSNNGKTGGEYNIMEELIAIIDKLFTGVDATDKDIRAIRHTLGSLFTKYDKGSQEWEYSDDLAYILSDELPEILDVFEGNYGNLLVLLDALMKSKGNSEGFLLYVMKTLKSAYPTRDVIEQLRAFIKTDIIARHDSALWSDTAELLLDFVDMIKEEEQPGWFENDPFHGTGDVRNNSDPYRALGELLSW